LAYYNSSLKKYLTFKSLSKELKSCFDSQLIEYDEVLEKFLFSSIEFLEIDMKKLKFYKKQITPKFQKISNDFKIKEIETYHKIYDYTTEILKSSLKLVLKHDFDQQGSSIERSIQKDKKIKRALEILINNFPYDFPTIKIKMFKR